MGRLSFDGEKARKCKSCVDEEGWEGSRAASERAGEAHCVREDARGVRMRHDGQSTRRPPAWTRNPKAGLSARAMAAAWPSSVWGWPLSPGPTSLPYAQPRGAPRAWGPGWLVPAPQGLHIPHQL